MTNSIISHAESDLHARLFSHIRDIHFDMQTERGGVQFGVTFDRVTQILRDNTVLKKDQDTGLWHHVAKETSPGIYWRPPFSSGYFQIFWTSGRLLNRALMNDDNAGLIDDKFVLSFGSGSGLAEINLVRKRRPRLVACLDTDVYARAAIELTAQANDVPVGDVLVTIANPGIIKPVIDGAKTYRLFDTVIASDCLYGSTGARIREVETIVASLKNLNTQGAEVLIADLDYIELTRRLADRAYRGRYTENCEDRVRPHVENNKKFGFTKQTLFAAAEIEVDTDATSLINLMPLTPTQPVTIHHWKQTASALPLLDVKWWQPPAAKP
jgi:predicted nicotinamide N-methyase